MGIVNYAAAALNNQRTGIANVVIRSHGLAGGYAIFFLACYHQQLLNCDFTVVHGEFVNYAAIGIWNRPRQWYRQA